ncbi:MAG: hypothetical protein L0229_13640, partial [Blastocatellia bacterium]|nr:hypothetical protein [Blastocatellia bacterium]
AILIFSGHVASQAPASAKSAQTYRARAIEAEYPRNTEIYHTDLTALTPCPLAVKLHLTETGSGLVETPASLDLGRLFREITIHHNESQYLLQPFSLFHDPAMYFTLSTGTDGPGINYGVAVISPEILTHRSRIAPLWDCAEHKFEESFLSSRAAGDPSMPVDVLANSPSRTAQLENELLNVQPTGDPPCSPKIGPESTGSFFPNDPSNVCQSCMRDHTKFRILHGRISLHHVHHYRTHRRLHSPEGDDGYHTDSQAIYPGASFDYDGSGNRNLIIGDSIFHRRFYLDFAAGMKKRDFHLWALHRVCDVVEAGTLPHGIGRPSPGACALNLK